jgi:hypothetical protein
VPEIGFKKKKKAKDFTGPDKIINKKEIYNQIIKEIESGKSYHEITLKYPEIKYFIFMDRIYDLENYFHPGGNYIID